MDNIAGSPVEGANFFGRSAVAQDLWDTLQNDDILLLGPRRIGKTSAARAVMTLARDSGWKAIEINVAACVDEKGFLDKLGAELKRPSTPYPENCGTAPGKNSAPSATASNPSSSVVSAARWTSA